MDKTSVLGLNHRRDEYHLIGLDGSSSMKGVRLQAGLSIRPEAAIFSTLDIREMLQKANRFSRRHSPQ